MVGRNMFSRNNQEKLKKKQDKIDSGLVSLHFPGVSGIVIRMTYNQDGARTVHRVLNYYPSSYAFFRIDCLSDDCVDGGFDLDRIIYGMVRNHREESKGELVCDDSGPRPGHSKIAYEIEVQYA